MKLKGNEIMFVMPNMVPGTSQVFNEMQITHVVFSGDNGGAVFLKSCLAWYRLV